jgi:hypothetical protein
MRTDAGVTFLRRTDAPASDRVLAAVLPTDEFLRWSPDSRAIWVRRSDEIPLRVTQIDIATGRRAPLMEFEAKDQHGLLVYPGPSLADDPKVGAFVVRRYLSQIFVVTGER